MVKVNGRPVLFYPLPFCAIITAAVRHGEYASIQALCADRQDSLAQLIGAQGSLQEALRQCKAAISYPQVCRCCCGALLAPGKVF